MLIYHIDQLGKGWIQAWRVRHVSAWAYLVKIYNRHWTPKFIIVSLSIQEIKCNLIYTWRLEFGGGYRFIVRKSGNIREWEDRSTICRTSSACGNE